MNWESQWIALLSASVVRPFVLVAAAALLLRALGVRHPASRHAVWSFVLFAMLLVPVVSVVAPHWLVPVPAAAAQSPAFIAREPAATIEPQKTEPHKTLSTTPQVASPIPSELRKPAPGISIPTLIVWIYLAGLFAMLLYRFAGWILLRRVIARSAQLKPRLRESNHVIAPVAAGVLRPAVILPVGWRDWNLDTRRAVLAHEFAHIRRRDTLVSALARFVKCVLWFHPLAWWLSRKISELAELACDAVALESLRDPGEYSRILFAFAERVNRTGHRVALPGLAMAASSSGMRQRIDHVFELADGGARKLARPAAWLVLIGLPVMGVAATLGLGESGSLSLPFPQSKLPSPPVLRIVAQVQAPTSSARPNPSAAPRPVTVHVSVTDRNNAFVENLPQSAFRIFENSSNRPVTMFREEQRPLSAGVIIDNSGSMREKGATLLAAARAVATLPTPDDEMFVVSFNEHAYLDQDWTSDEAKLTAALDKNDFKGGTSWRDAVSLSIDKIQSGGKNPTKALFLITDGDDNTSAISMADLARKAQESGIPIFCIHTGAPPEGGAAPRALLLSLQKVAAISGGRDYDPKNRTELDEMTARLLHAIRSDYVLEYVPDNSTFDASSRDIRVIVDFPDLNVRIRK
ncbi:MAG TPA: VWA domain-containing protein [Bryobacteraceae bacterium]|jgi:VWFA-related protein